MVYVGPNKFTRACTIAAKATQSQLYAVYKAVYKDPNKTCRFFVTVPSLDFPTKIGSAHHVKIREPELKKIADSLCSQPESWKNQSQGTLLLRIFTPEAI